MVIVCRYNYQSFVQIIIVRKCYKGITFQLEKNTNGDGKKYLIQPISLVDRGFSDLISGDKSWEKKDKGNKRIKWKLGKWQWGLYSR